MTGNMFVRKWYATSTLWQPTCTTISQLLSPLPVTTLVQGNSVGRPCALDTRMTRRPCSSLLTSELCSLQAQVVDVTLHLAGLAQAAIDVLWLEAVGNVVGAQHHHLGLVRCLGCSTRE